MKKIIHRSAKPSHYDFQAKEYDVICEEGSKAINRTVESILKKYRVKTVLDVTCGTGSQVFWLNKCGYGVVGSDISQKMLNVAKSKSKKLKSKIKLIKADMCTVNLGKFDAVISIFNAVGHLTKSDFEKAMRSIAKNLNPGGLYIFDNFNLNYLLQGDNITKLTMDQLENSLNSVVRKVQYSTIDETGVLASFTTLYTQHGKSKPMIKLDTQTLQTYSIKQLKAMLEKNGFKMVRHCNVDGSRFSGTKSERMLVVAKKVR